uniref:Uncharacterized protein n=1 Tax=Oryza sativa subsp. japonica TaxID=39947 RepID=Q6Z9N4_ORYSJ|nr:hypothetical protein [Oryza sativa Japonica Group]BAD12982.1 hypothetical protein [Oryza sativa Japonica Group]
MHNRQRVLSPLSPEAVGARNWRWAWPRNDSPATTSGDDDGLKCPREAGGKQQRTQPSDGRWWRQARAGEAAGGSVTSGGQQSVDLPPPAPRQSDLPPPSLRPPDPRRHHHQDADGIYLGFDF